MNNLKEDMLFEKIGNIDDDFLEEVEKIKETNKKPLSHRNIFIAAKRIVAVACILLIVTVGISTINLFRSMKYVGLSSHKPEKNGFKENGKYDVYAGPVFPMTTLEDMKGIAVVRDVSFDFSKYEKNTNSNQSILLTDTYTLTNTSNEAETFHILYPFVSDIVNMKANLPDIISDGKQPDTTFYIGNYFGGYDTYNFIDIHPGTDGIKQCTDYIKLLADGSYMDTVLSDQNSLAGVPVIEYEFSANYYAPNMTTFYVECKMNDAKYLQQGFDSFTQLDNQTVSFGTDWYNGGASASLLIVGEDITNIHFKDAGNNPLDTSDITMKRTETTLDQCADKYAEIYYEMLMEDMHDNLYPAQDETSVISLTAYHKLFCQYLYSVLLTNHTEYIGQSYTASERLLTLPSYDMLCYVSAEITVPANQSLVVTVNSVKNGSYSRRGHHNKHTDGYDFLTKAGSTLEFSNVSLSLKNYDNIKIVNQNFGFDLDKNIDTISLDTQNDYYYIVVENKYTKTTKKPWYQWWS